MYLGCSLPRYPTCSSSSNVLVGYWSQVIKKDAVMTGSKFDGSVSDVVLDNDWGGFPGGSVVKNPPANEGDTGLIFCV